MRFSIIIFLLVATSVANTTELNIEKIELSNGEGSILQVEEIPRSRNMPWVYYDQAIDSILSVYPKSVIVAKERLGKTGERNEVIYSLVGYKEIDASEEVKVSGIVVAKEKAWRFNLQVNESSLAETLQIVVQELGKLPYNEL